jgi:hypothetical protein
MILFSLPVILISFKLLPMVDASLYMLVLRPTDSQLKLNMRRTLTYIITDMNDQYIRLRHAYKLVDKIIRNSILLGANSGNHRSHIVNNRGF